MFGGLSAVLSALILRYGEEKGTSFTAEEGAQIIQKIKGFGYDQEDIEEFSQSKFNYLADANWVGKNHIFCRV